MDIQFTNADVLRAFLLTLFAGLSTGLGGLFVLRKREMDQKFLATSLGLSAGVMIYISFVEMLASSFSKMQDLHGEKAGGWYTLIAFFGGIALIAAIDAFIPEQTNPHEMRGLDYVPSKKDQEQKQVLSNEEHQLHKQKSAMYRTGMLSMLAIGIHNFPEGIASFISALADPTLGVSIAVAIAIHNIPEGISVAIPIKFSTGSNKKAINYAFLSGLAEPIGAMIGFFFLRPFINETMLAIVYAVVAGIMVFISLDELLPAAQRLKEHHHNAMIGLVLGMLVMAVTLQLL